MTISKIILLFILGLLMKHGFSQENKEVSILTDKYEYSKGETIKLTVINNLDSTIIYAKSVRCGALFFDLNDCNGNNLIYHDNCLWDDFQHNFTELIPNDTLVGYWDQSIYTSFEYKEAQPGCYKFALPYFINNKKKKMKTWDNKKQEVYSNKFRID